MTPAALRARFSAALLEFAWDEWAQMGVLAAPRRESPWAQDPEALLLLSLEVARDDPRLFDEVLDWVGRNEPLVSKRRLRTFSHDADDERLVGAVLEWAARRRRPRSAERTSEPAGAPEPLFRSADLPTLRRDPVFATFGLARPPAEPSGKSREPDSSAPINFAFRLRHLLGVSARAEAVRHLLTAGIRDASVADVAASSGYAKRNIQEALGSLHVAGVVSLLSTRAEQRFAVDRARWAHLLDLEPHELPLHRDWATFSRAARRILRWLTRPELDSLSEYMRASEAADLLDEVRPQLSRAGVIMPARLGRERSWNDLEETIDDALLWLAPERGTSGRPAAFEIVADTSGGHRWRVTTASGRIVATSADTYASRATARAAAERIQGVPDRFAYRVTPDAGAFRWSIVADSGRILAASAESFATVHDAERAARAARDLVAGAAAPSEASEASTASIDPGRRHVMLRPDGRWEVRGEGATRASSTHATQGDAVRSARLQARNNRSGGVVVVHGRDGRIRASDTIPPASAPKDRT